MTTKTASIRLEKSRFKEIDNKCSLLGCTRNDFVKKAIENELNESHKAENRFPNCENCDEESHQTLNLIIDKIHDSDWCMLNDDDNGRPLHVEINWNYDQETT